MMIPIKKSFNLLKKCSRQLLNRGPHQLHEVLELPVPAGDGLLKLGARLIEARKLPALVVRPEERVDQPVAPDRLQGPLAGLVLARVTHLSLRHAAPLTPATLAP